LRDSRVRPSKRAARQSDALALVGFGLAWIATTGSGALLVGQWMTPPHGSSAVAPLTAAVDIGHHAPASPAPAFPPPCAWEPPLVSVKDLPPAPPATRASHEVAPRVAAPAPAPAPAPAVAAVVSPPRPVLRSDRRADVASRVTHGQRAAKAGPPHSLEDWIRGAVNSPSPGSS
jgi:hypothetical protein